MVVHNQDVTMFIFHVTSPSNDKANLLRTSIFSQIGPHRFQRYSHLLILALDLRD